MLDPNTFLTLAAARNEGTDQSGSIVWDIVDALRHHKILILAVTVLTTALGTVYAITTPPRYSASSQVIIDSRRVLPFTGQAIIQDLAIDTTAADNQVEVLHKSEAVHLATVEILNLHKDPEFTVKQTSMTRSFLEHLGVLPFLERLGVLQPAEVESNDDPVGRALRYLGENLSVRRVGRTYVIEVTFRSRSRDTAARVANAVVRAYIFEKVQSDVSATTEASEWLRDRLAELRKDAMNADSEVQEYIAKNNLITAQSGRTLTEQQLSDLQVQLSRLRGEVAEAKARFDALAGSEETDPSSVATIGNFNNPVLTRLRDQYLDMHRQEAEFVSRYGENHLAVAEIRKNLQSLRDASREEIRRTAAAFGKEYEIARSRLDSLEQSLKETLDATAAGMRAGVSLRILESSAQSYRRLYDSILQRFADSRQEQTFPRSDARVLTTARDSYKTEPNVKLILAAALFAGLAGGVGLALTRQRLDFSIRSASKLEGSIGAECFGMVPEISHRDAKRHRRLAAQTASRKAGHGDTRHESRAVGAAIVSKRPDRHLSDLALERHAVHTPFSEFAEALRRIKVASDMSTPEAVILGFVSTTAGEGASFMAVNFAQLLASDGIATLLIDGDLRRSSLSKRMAPEAKAGLAQLLETDAALDDLLWTDQMTGLAFLPTGTETALANSATILASPKVEAVLSAARLMYRYIVIDLPPLDEAVDAKATGEIIDRFLLVTAWGRTSHYRVETGLRSAEVIRTRLIGGILNRADVRVARRTRVHHD
jgi:polysaccharide biosynthesis transport protein